MNRFTQYLGSVIWWLAWPFWLVYFRMVPRRSRVVVLHADKILLVKTWLGDGKWGLPGGGAKRNEPIERSACRELKEETGIHTVPNQLKPLGQFTHKRAGLRYQAYLFVYHLDKPARLQRRRPEIADIGWFDLATLKDLPVNDDVQTALAKWAGQLGIINT